MLGHQALCSLLRSSASSARIGGGSEAVVGRRGFSNNAPATATNSSHQDFIAAWMKLAPNMEPSKTPLTFMKPRPAVPGLIPAKVTINFVFPYQVELSNKEVIGQKSEFWAKKSMVAYQGFDGKFEGYNNGKNTKAIDQI